jgi:hypothetical protein
MKTIIILIASLFNHHSDIISLDNGRTELTISVSKITVKSDIIEPKELIHYLDRIFTDSDVQYYNIEFQTHGEILIVDEISYKRIPNFVNKALNR